MKLEMQIIQIISAERRAPANLFPAPISRRIILQCLNERLSPNDNKIDDLEFMAALSKLEERGEIVMVGSQRYCMARPNLIVIVQAPLRTCFVGDRTFLSLAHKTMESEQDYCDPEIHSRLTLEEAREKLEAVDITIQTWAEMLEELPRPGLPSLWSMRDFKHEQDELDVFSSLEVYSPSHGVSQNRRWKKCDWNEPVLASPYRLQDGQYIWRQGTAYYKLNKDTALLAMFALDIQFKAPLILSWRVGFGSLDLSDIWLPFDYWRLIMRLSTQDSPENSRIRNVKPKDRQAVSAILTRLGIPV